MKPQLVHLRLKSINWVAKHSTEKSTQSALTTHNTAVYFWFSSLLCSLLLAHICFLHKKRIINITLHSFSYILSFFTENILHLRNRKHFPCFYQVIETRVEVWENKKCCGNTSRRRVFPQLFWVLPNFHECFCNSTETRRKCFLFLLENSQRKITKNEENLSFIYHQNVDSLHHTIYTS